MRMDYISFANMVDLAVYTVSIVFVLNIKSDWEIGDGCTGDTVSQLELHLLIIF